MAAISALASRDVGNLLRGLGLLALRGGAAGGIFTAVIATNFRRRAEGLPTRTKTWALRQGRGREAKY